jgi:hypothetical protein
MTTLHNDGMRRRVTVVGNEQHNEDGTTGTPRKTTASSHSSSGISSPTTDIISKKAGAVRNDDTKPKRKLPYQHIDSSRTMGAVFVFLGLCVVLFELHRTSNNYAYTPSLLIKRFSNILPHPKMVDTLGDGPVPRSNGWHLWGYHTFKDKFNCSAYLADKTKPLPTMEYWQTMLNAYNQVVDPTYKFDDVVPPTQGYRLNEDGPQPYYAKLSPGKGRGVFASRDIKKGEIVHNGTKSDVVFPNATSWKRFMFALPRKMACDNAEWTFIQRYEEGGPMRIVSSLNIAILMNEGDTLEQVNVEPQNEDRNFSEYATVLYATRDIKKDEEILMDYDDYPTDLNAAGLADLILSPESCRSLETCSVSEFVHMFKIMRRDIPWFMPAVVVYIVCSLAVMYHL